MIDLFANYGTGALPLPPDPRDRSALLHPRIARAVHVGTADTVRLGGQIGGIYNQDGEGACVAFSEAGVVSREETIQGRPWVWLDAENLYRRNGGTGQNGVDTRQTLQDIIDHGINRQDGGPPIKEGSYLFVPKQPGIWEATIMAALAVGKAVTLATYLPTTFGWDSSGAPDPNRYHQVYISGGDPLWWEIVNSWGSGFGQNGLGRLLKSFVDPLRGDVYAYVVAEADIVPTPLPTPLPTPTPTRQLSGMASGLGLATLATGNIVKASTDTFSGSLQITQIQDGQPTPTPLPTPTPTPTPTPSPTPQPQPQPGQLTVAVPTHRYSGNMAGIWAYPTADGRPIAAHLTGTAGSTTLDQHDGSIGVWVIRGPEAAPPLTVTITATAPDGRTGTGRATV